MAVPASTADDDGSAPSTPSPGRPRPERVEAHLHKATLDLRESRQVQRRTRLFGVCLVVTIAGLVASMATQRPDILALCAPFAAALAGAFALYRRPDAEVSLLFDASRIVEGETLAVAVEIASAVGVPRIEVELDVSDRLAPERTLRAVTTVAAGEVARVDFPLVALEWGEASIENVGLRLTGRFGMFGGRLDFATDDVIRIGMPEQSLQVALDADRFRRIVGTHSSRDRGQGLEIADIRPWQPGDPAKSINWRISNRRDEPWVTLRHPDRSTTIVIVVDAHEGEDQVQRSSQRRSVLAALALAKAHLSVHDQVGLLIVGHTVRWLPPRLGRNQMFGIADELVAVSNAPEASLRLYRPPAVNTITSETIIVAISPLLDPRMAALLAELRSRGNPVSVLVPESAAASIPSRWSAQEQEAVQLAAVEYVALTTSLRERGVAIVNWPEEESASVVVESLRRMRQTMQRAR